MGYYYTHACRKREIPITPAIAIIGKRIMKNVIDDKLTRTKKTPLLCHSVRALFFFWQIS